ncbi:DUF302 domain-containing protein [Prauserella muralis]|uniref:DUF302 domain-containing protein n=1 Tax=Prauserella muralis TaxID=588067 RepID=A0A2V4B518_9PSEU|nr:DUF302 domain-containing protein [Prauserella muralis]PXY28488.1 hypothetical protein BAY60_18280 [Prauserella muralis]
METSYGRSVRLRTTFADAVEHVRAALKDQGFGVLTEIDVRATLHEKLGRQMEDYLILGACNPELADQALGIDHSVGLLLPCNVVIRSDRHDVLVEAVDPQILVTVTGRAELGAIADEAARRLAAALESLLDSVSVASRD